MGFFKKKKIKEKKLDNIVFTNADVTKLDIEHTYIFRVKQEYLLKAPKEAVEKMCKALKEALDRLDIKYVIIAEGIFDITELVI